MSEPLFLVDELPKAGPYRLIGPEGHHAADVQRLRVGEALLLADGRGGLADAVVTATLRGALDLSVTASRQVPAADPRLVVAQGIPKGERGELAVATMTEIGADEIVPWAAARCVAQWRGDRGERSLARWRATAREAAKQSRRAWSPAIGPVASTAALAERAGSTSAAGVTLVLHEAASARLTAVDLPAAGELLVVVGPEGGIAPEELVRFVEAGAVPVRLGETVLRTSTAGAAALAVLSARLRRW